MRAFRLYSYRYDARRILSYLTSSGVQGQDWLIMNLSHAFFLYFWSEADAMQFYLCEKDQLSGNVEVLDQDDVKFLERYLLINDPKVFIIKQLPDGSDGTDFAPL